MNEPNQAPVQTIPIDVSKMTTLYSNFVRGLMTPEEIILDFGFNPNSGGKIVEEPAAVAHRIILNPSSAVRLHQLLQSILLKRQQLAEEAAKQATAPEAGVPNSSSGNPA